MNHVITLIENEREQLIYKKNKNYQQMLAYEELLETHKQNYNDYCDKINEIDSYLKKHLNE